MAVSRFFLGVGVVLGVVLGVKLRGGRCLNKFPFSGTHIKGAIRRDL